MTATTHTPTVALQHADAATRPRQTVWKHGVAVAAAAAAVTTSLAAVMSAVGVSFDDPDGVALPLWAFTQLTVVFTLVGVALAAVLARTVRHPRSTFVRTTVALTALSVVPDLTFGFDAATAVTLAALHVTAASIVIPTLAARLARTR
jgi:hypothetical protein